jgi:hypothetical protein
MQRIMVRRSSIRGSIKRNSGVSDHSIGHAILMCRDIMHVLVSLLDMVGGEGSVFMKEGYSEEFAPI